MKWKLVGLVFGLLFVAMVATVEAGITIVPGGITGVDFKDWENLSVDGNLNGLLDPGDVLRGIVQGQDTSVGMGGTTFKDLLPGNTDGQPEFTAVFEVVCLAKYPTGFGTFNFIMGPTGTLGADIGVPTLPLNTVIAFWTDTTFELNAAMITENGAAVPNPANVEAVVTNGTPWAAFGFGTSRLDETASSFGTLNPAGDGYWFVLNAGDAVPVPVGFASFSFGLEALAWPGAIPPAWFVGIKNPLQVIPGLQGDLDNLVGIGNAFANPDTNTDEVYGAASGDPAGFYVIPEPASVVVWALFVALGIGVGIRRRK